LAVQEAKDKELDALHERVRAAIAKRDDVIMQLRAQLEEANSRAAKLYEVGGTLSLCFRGC
jgi:hypothetical protein